MAVPFDTPVVAIEGIGPQAQRLFNAQGVFTVYDLLRAQSPALHGAVAAIASLEEVKKWRQAAVLLEVASITPQWAEALVKGGITSLTELRRLTLDELQTLFTKAKDDGTIPDVPIIADMVAMLTDASVLDYTGAITGTVKDRDGTPVAGATVTGAGRDVLTNAQGRFRLRRLMLGTETQLSITKPGLAPLSPSVRSLPTSTVEVIQFTLTPEIVTRPRPSGQTRGPLSEVNGDRMPAMQRADVTSGEVELSTLRTGDLLMLTEFYANDRDAKLVSKLLNYDGSRYIVRWVRLPKTSLPAGSVIGNHFLKTPTGFRKVAMTPGKLNSYKKLLRTRRSRPPRPTATTMAERYLRVAETLARAGRQRS